MSIRTIVVAGDEIDRNRYQQLVTAHGVECLATGNLHEMFELLKQQAYHGLLIDLATLVKADKAEKAKCHELLRLYPTLRLRWDEKTEQPRCLLYGSLSNTGMSIQIFIEEHCRKFEGRRIRKHKRVSVHYNTLIAKNEQFQGPDVERATTIDISVGGCSILTQQNWTIGETVWIRFMEFSDPSPIPVKICRYTPWGIPMEFPSIGVCFLSLTPAQLEQINHPGKAVYEKQHRLD